MCAVFDTSHIFRHHHIPSANNNSSDNVCLLAWITQFCCLFHFHFFFISIFLSKSRHRTFFHLDVSKWKYRGRRAYRIETWMRPKIISNWNDLNSLTVNMHTLRHIYIYILPFQFCVMPFMCYQTKRLTQNWRWNINVCIVYKNACCSNGKSVQNYDLAGLDGFAFLLKDGKFHISIMT